MIIMDDENIASTLIEQMTWRSVHTETVDSTPQFWEFSSNFMHTANRSRVSTRVTKQETQLSLTNRATRLEVSHGHQTWYHSIC